MNKITREYIKELDEVKSDIELIISKIESDEIDENVYRMGILSMCIRYESFTSEVFSFLFKDVKVKYNHPWSYTRQIAKELSLDLDLEYISAHECWEFYNTLKHINMTTRRKREALMKKHNLHSFEKAFYWIYESLMDLIDKFLI